MWAVGRNSKSGLQIMIMTECLINPKGLTAWILDSDDWTVVANGGYTMLEKYLKNLVN